VLHSVYTLVLHGSVVCTYHCTLSYTCVICAVLTKLLQVQDKAFVMQIMLSAMNIQWTVRYSICFNDSGICQHMLLLVLYQSLGVVVPRWDSLSYIIHNTHSMRNAVIGPCARAWKPNAMQVQGLIYQTQTARVTVADYTQVLLC
jgi:hypothetical protein